MKTSAFNRALSAILVIVIIVLVLASRRAFHKAESRIDRPDIGVAELVQKLRQDLEKLERDRISQDESAILQIKSVDVEINFVVKVDQNNKNEVHFDAITVGQDQSLSLERTNKVTLHLEIEPPSWVSVQPSTVPLSVDQNTRELPPVPLGRSVK
jgi:hypothetical protein